MWRWRYGGLVLCGVKRHHIVHCSDVVLIGGILRLRCCAFVGWYCAIIRSALCILRDLPGPWVGSWKLCRGGDPPKLGLNKFCQGRAKKLSRGRALALAGPRRGFLGATACRPRRGWCGWHQNIRFWSWKDIIRVILTHAHLPHPISMPRTSWINTLPIHEHIILILMNLNGIV